MRRKETFYGGFPRVIHTVALLLALAMAPALAACGEGDTTPQEKPPKIIVPVDPPPPVDTTVWRVAAPLPTPNSLYGAAFANGLYIGAGLQGTIITSTDGVTWATTHVPDAPNLWDVTFHEGLGFLAVGMFGAMYLSADGAEWTPLTPGVAVNLRGSSRSPTRSVVVGDGGTVLHSTDGAGWTSLTLPDTRPVNDVLWIGDRFIAVGDGGIFESADGLDWALVSVANSLNLRELTQGGGLVVAVGTGGRVFYSTNAVSWSMVSVPGAVLPPNFTGVHWNGSLYVAVSPTGIHTSPDATTWTAQTSPANDLSAVAGDGARTFAVGNQGNLVSSTDGTTWTRHNGANSTWYMGVTWDGFRFIAVGWGDPETGTVVATSADGIIWEKHPPGTISTLFSVAGNGEVAIAGNPANGKMVISYDGANWSEQTTGAVGGVQRLKWLDGLFVGAGNNGGIYTSTDGVAWADVSLPGTTSDHFAIAGAPGLTLVAGQFSTLATSTNHVDWEVSSIGTAQINGLAWNGSVFSAVGANTAIYSSTDGVGWTPITGNLFTGILEDVVDNSTAFVAVGGGGLIISSPDGTDWTRESSRIITTLHGVATNGTRLVAVGEGGVILYTP